MTSHFGYAKEKGKKNINKTCIYRKGKKSGVVMIMIMIMII